MKEDLLDIINDMVDMVECYLDQYGNCWTHGWFSRKECPHSRAKRVLGQEKKTPRGNGAHRKGKT